MPESWCCPVCRWNRETPVSHERCVEQAVRLVGRLMLRWAGGLEGDPFRDVGPWVRDAEEEAEREAEDA